MGKHFIYALYNGEGLVGCGTTEELAAITGLNQNYIQQMNSPSRKRSHTWTLIKVEEGMVINKSDKIKYDSNWDKEVIITPIVEKIIFDAMEEQEVSHRPRLITLTRTKKKILENHGGIKAICRKMGILTKQEMEEAIERGHEKTIERNARMSLFKVRELHKNDVY